jgi:hypothetical protein
MDGAVAILGAAAFALAVAFGCSSESTNAPNTGGTSSGGTSSGGSSSGGASTGGSSTGATGGQAGGAAVDACVPLACGSPGAECGAVPDGCGATITCAGCVGLCSSAHNCCPPGKPTSAFDPVGKGIVCNQNNLLATDDKVAGLDYHDSGGVDVDGKFVTSCLAVDFGAVYQMDSVIVRAARSDAACEAMICTQCSELGLVVFRGVTQGSYTYVADQTLTNSLIDYPIVLGGGVRFIVICRPGGGSSKNDIAIDSIVPAACN